MTVSLEKEKSERVKILLKNAELTQNEESLRQDLKQERDELDELLEQTKTLQRNLKIHEKNEKDLMLEIDGLTRRVHEKEHFEKEFQRISSDLQEKDKVRIDLIIWIIFKLVPIFTVNKSPKSAIGRHEEDAAGGDQGKSQPETE